MYIEFYNPTYIYIYVCVCVYNCVKGHKCIIYIIDLTLIYIIDLLTIDPGP